MIKIIRGCLVKYGIKWPDGTIILKGAFDENRKIIPVTQSFFHDRHDEIGYCELDYRDDGVYYIFHSANTEAAKKALDEKTSWTDDCYIGVYCNGIHRQEKDSKIVAKANIVSGAICIGNFESAYVESIELESDDAHDEHTHNGEVRLGV